MIASSYPHLVTPLVALGGLAVILLMCRWVFSTSARDARTAARSAARASTTPTRRGGDYGLLVPVATVRTHDDAEMLRAVLTAADIRCTVVEDDEGADVLVFRQDALRARDLVSS